MNRTGVIVLPDAVAVIRDYLLAVREVFDLVEDRIATRSPANPVYPYITLQRIGGPQPATGTEWIDKARFQVDAWGAQDDEAGASLVIRTVLAALKALRHAEYQHPTAIVSEVDQDLGVTWLPDTSREPAQPRFTFGVIVTLHPNPNQ